MLQPKKPHGVANVRTKLKKKMRFMRTGFREKLTYKRNNATIKHISIQPFWWYWCVYLKEKFKVVIV